MCGNATRAAASETRTRTVTGPVRVEPLPVTADARWTSGMTPEPAGPTSYRTTSRSESAWARVVSRNVIHGPALDSVIDRTEPACSTARFSTVAHGRIRTRRKI